MEKDDLVPQKKYKRLFFSFLCVFLIICAGFVSWAIFHQNKQFSSTGFVMGSFMQQTIYGKDGETAAAEALAKATATESLISWKTENSDIAKVNESAGVSAVSVSDETIRILSVCRDAAEKSGGAFDPCILPLSSLWNFDGETNTVPQENQIEKFLQFVSYENLSIDGNNVFLKNTGCGIDLGAAGKGAACDDAVSVYKESAVMGAVVSVGGSIGVYGKKPGGGAWGIAVRDPYGEALESIGIISMNEGFISTSGSYEKYFDYNGKRYHHILDSATGYPKETDLVSVTVIAKTGVLSDILSTACFCLGAEESRALLAEYGASAIFVDNERKITVLGEVSFELTNSDYSICE